MAVRAYPIFAIGTTDSISDILVVTVSRNTKIHKKKKSFESNFNRNNAALIIDLNQSTEIQLKHIAFLSMIPSTFQR